MRPTRSGTFYGGHGRISLVINFPDDPRIIRYLLYEWQYGPDR